MNVNSQPSTPTPSNSVVTDLKPCPFCGGEITVGGRSFGWFGHKGKVAGKRSNCPIFSEDFPPSDRDAWNTRAAMQSAHTTGSDDLVADEPVRCGHEAYQGHCAHCGVPIINGVAKVSRPSRAIATPDTDRVAVLEAKLAKADLARAAYARALEKMRLMLVSVHDELEDEGDRVYLGSTNHADQIREVWQLADALHWDEILADTQPDTPLAQTNLRIQAERAELTDRVAVLTEALSGLIDAVTIDANGEHGISGFTAAHLTDARAALNGDPR